jgi:hypothetical protein
MQYIGDTKLPLQGTMKILGDDVKILDYLFDMKLPDLQKYLSKLHTDDTPALLIAKVGQMGFVGLFMYLPPDIWLDFDNQKYQLYLSPNLPMLIHHWVDRRMRTHDIFESEVLTKIIGFLEEYIQNQTVSHT